MSSNTAQPSSAVQNSSSRTTVRYVIADNFHIDPAV